MSLDEKSFISELYACDADRYFDASYCQTLRGYCDEELLKTNCVEVGFI